MAIGCNNSDGYRGDFNSLTFADHLGKMSDHLYIVSLMQCMGCQTKLSDNVAIGRLFLQTYNLSPLDGYTLMCEVS